MNILKPSLIGISIALALNLTACNPTPKQITTDVKEAHQKNSSLTYVRTVEGIDEFTLENGLKVLLFQDESQPKTLVNLTYRVGSVHENYGETGMAHLLEHMLFKGSTSYKNISEEFKKRGMGTNATTWLDRTNYFEVFDANEGSLEWALGMEADRMLNATFTEQELKSEMTVVRNEMEKGENDPIRMLLSRMSSLAHLWHNYGKSTIGARSDVENFPFPKLRAFYKKHYRPDNAVLTIAGRFDKEKTKAIIEKKFGAIAKPNIPVEALYTVEPVQDGEREVNIRRVGDIPYIGLMYHAPSGLHKDAAALQVLEEILSDQTRGRLQKQLVEKGISTSAFSFTFSLKDSSQIIFIAQGEKEKSTAELEQSLISIAENIKSTPITDKEIKIAKLKLAKQSEQAMRNVTGIGMELSEYIAKGDYRHNFYFRDQVESVTKEQVQAAAERYIIQSNRTLGRFIPTKSPVRAEIPKPPSLDEELKDYTGRKVISSGEVYDNTVTNIKNRVVETVWPEGTQVIVYPKKLRGEEIIIKMSFPVGSAQSLSDKGIALGYIGAMIKMGNAQYTKEQIATKLDELKSSISFNSGVNGIDIYISTDKNNVKKTIKLLSELLINPSFPESEIKIFKRAMIAGIEKQRNDPKAIAANTFRSNIYNYPKGHPKAYLTLDEKIAAINAIDSPTLTKLYQEQMAIQNGLIGIVGDVNPQNVSAYLRTALAEHVNDIPYQHVNTNFQKVQGLVVSTETPDKANAQIFTINPIDMNTSHNDYLALYIANSIFGGDTFTSRIGKRIRVKEGYSYGVGSGVQVNSIDEQGFFYMQAISAPENMDALIQAYKEEMQLVVDQGFTTEELDTAVKGFISSRNRNWADDSRIPGLLISAKRINRNLSFYDQQIESVQKLTITDIHQAFIKYVASQEINIFKAGDFAKSK